MCRDRARLSRRLVISTAPMLSTHSTVGCDMSRPISANRLRMKMISVAASDAAMGAEASALTPLL
eukprot:scaffold40039_cov67-Phaeocystis_antarctica.AAC.2